MRPLKSAPATLLVCFCAAVEYEPGSSYTLAIDINRFKNVLQDRLNELFGAVGNIHMILFEILFKVQLLSIFQFESTSAAVTVSETWLVLTCLKVWGAEWPKI